MQPKEPLDIRKEMVAMHEEYISRLQSTTGDASNRANS